MIHSSISKPQVVSSVRTSGHDGNLAKGQLAVVKDRGIKGQGLQVVSDFSGMSKNDHIQIKIGEVTTPTGLRIKEVASKSTGWFSLSDIIEISAHVPSQTKLEVDYLEVGYDGLKDTSALFIPEGKSATLDLMLYGEVASMFFGTSEYLITKEVYRPEGATMQEVIQKVVKELQEERVPSATGWASVTDQLSQYLEIGIIDSSNPALSGVNYTFSTVVIADKGDSNDLAAVQAQYPLYKVALADRKGDNSTYRILHPSSVSLANVSIVNTDVQNKDCADCLAGYSEIAGGFVYHVSLEDDGVDQTTTVDNIANFVAGSVVRLGNDLETGKGGYSFVTSVQLTDAEKATFLATNAITSTASFSFKGKVEDICFSTSTVTYTWSPEKVCKATTEQFNIVLPDNECGATRLSELAANYPDLVIEEGKATGQARQTVTISGSSGDTVISINGTSYTQAYDTSPTVTATNFVTAHAASILAATGLVVTSSAAILTFNGQAKGFPTIAGVAGGLTETVGALDYLVTASEGGCKRVYSTYVVTNLVCDECDDIFLQSFSAEAPENFENTSWEAVDKVYDEDAKMGIFVKGKPYYMYPEIYEEDYVPYVETSLKIKSITFGAKGSLLLNYDGNIYDPETEYAPSRQLRFASDVNNNAVALFGAERMGNKHFTNKDIHSKNLFARTNLSQERILKYHKKYVQYAVKWKDGGLSQGGGSRSDITHETRYIIEYGKHEDLQNVLNNLAGKLGLDTLSISM